MDFKTHFYLSIWCSLLLIIGASLVTAVPPLENFCGEPRCETDEEIATLQISADPGYFFQCARNAAGIYAPLVRRCARNTMFGFVQQKCILISDWVDLCATK
jgi:hypothetical protein